MTPANLSFQWQRELKDKFQEKFEVVRSDVLRANYGSNPWQEKNQVVTSISWVSRVEDAKESLLRSHWDLIIVDEAHKMSAYSSDKKTLAYELGEKLSEMTDHYLLMTATPHKGDPENFRLFLATAGPGCIRRRREHRRGDSRSMRRRFTCVASRRRWFISPTRRPGTVRTLFTKRKVETIGFAIDDEEWDLYDALTRYVEDQSIKAAADRFSARPRGRLHDGDAATPFRFQHPRRPAQPGAHAGEATDAYLANPAAYRQQQIEAPRSRRFRRTSRRRAAGNHVALEDAVVSVDPGALKEEIGQLRPADRAGRMLEKREIESKLRETARSAHAARHFRRSEDEAPDLHRA